MTFIPITLGSGLSGYNYLARTRADQQAVFDRNPVTAREVAVATEKLQSVETVDDLMSDRTLLKVALGAFGLEEDLDNRAFIRTILESDLSDRRSVANKLTDKRYLALAQAFNFSGPEGPRLPDARGSDELIDKLEKLGSADELLQDRSLLRASLERFGLEENINNTYFLKQVLESDLSDPQSFANRMPDDRLVEFAETFDFFRKDAEAAGNQTPLDTLVSTLGPAMADIASAQDLLAAPDALEAALNIFGLQDIYTDTFLTDILDSDLNDAASFANSQSDTRLAAFAAAFHFATPALDDTEAPVLDDQGQPVFKTGNLEGFLSAVGEETGPFATADDFLSNRTLRQATFELLGIDQTFQSRRIANRVLSSDPDEPGSFANLYTDQRFKALSDLVTIEPVETRRIYPEGFVDQVVRNYLDRQFEISVGEVDPDMRVALSLERELEQVTRTSNTNDARWYSIMSSPPLRQAFEGAFRLPSSFGSIDIDQQLQVLKDRAEQFFGSSEVQDYLQVDRLDELRESYLLSRSTQNTAATSGASAASIILAGF